MKVISEMSLTSFAFWAGAEYNAKRLAYEEMEQIEEIIEELYPYGIDKVNINNLFWFEFKSAVEWLGYEYNKEKNKIIREEESEEEVE